MKKDFSAWHQKKEKIEGIVKRPFFHEREIWFCHFGVNIGFEQDGRGADFMRPVVVARKFNNEIFWGIPLTKAKKKIHKNIERYYFKFSFLPKTESLATLSQIRLIDAKRLSRHIGTLSEEIFKNLTKKLKDLLP